MINSNESINIEFLWKIASDHKMNELIPYLQRFAEDNISKWIDKPIEELERINTLTDNLLLRILIKNYRSNQLSLQSSSSSYRSTSLDSFDE